MFCNSLRVWKACHQHGITFNRYEATRQFSAITKSVSQNNTKSDEIGARQRPSMTIQTQETPNPNSMIFVLDTKVLEPGQTMNFHNIVASAGSPFAKTIFGINGVKSVLVGHEFVTVTKQTDNQWMLMKPAIVAAITDFFANDLPVVTGAIPTRETQINEEDDETVRMIKEILDSKIRPRAQEDGGDAVFVDFKDGVLRLKMIGACSSCPNSVVTLKSGILSTFEPSSNHLIPDSP
ncbi:NFU1 iron-sulfur cluster scaffold homolog, mitochondrial-like [Choristoneura fumiferana]|uniref:NFU1 iron-sulfur cluster scaffold homolog, mitochondrial-like n=1 Tax=Choristoneura fumiferana TaxID=7141 RepID=UPI003D15CA33